MYKIVGLDLDGTLLNEEKEITSYTKDVLKKARELGVYTVLASGRPLSGMVRYLEELDLKSENDYVLAFNGSLVQNVKTKEIISYNMITGQDLLDLYELSQKLNVNIHAFTKTKLITPKISEFTELEAKINGLEIHVTDFNGILPDDDIIKVMFIDEPSILQAAIDKLDKGLYEKYTVVRSAPFFLEFLHKSANKGCGLESLANYLGIKQEEVMSFGDAGNDMHMIKYAGKGVAMGNAFDEIKEIANYITKTNDEDGVAYAIEKFILNA